MEKLGKIKESIKEPISKLNMVVDSITYEKEGSYYFLRIVLDRVGGIDMDSIVEATHIINPIIDELDPYDESYILDISSKERNE